MLHSKCDISCFSSYLAQKNPLCLHKICFEYQNKTLWLESKHGLKGKCLKVYFIFVHTKIWSCWRQNELSVNTVFFTIPFYYFVAWITNNPSFPFFCFALSSGECLIFPPKRNEKNQASHIYTCTTD